MTARLYRTYLSLGLIAFACAAGMLVDFPLVPAGNRALAADDASDAAIKKLTADIEQLKKDLDAVTKATAEAKKNVEKTTTDAATTTKNADQTKKDATQTAADATSTTTKNADQTKKDATQTAADAATTTKNADQTKKDATQTAAEAATTNKNADLATEASKQANVAAEAAKAASGQSKPQRRGHDAGRRQGRQGGQDQEDQKTKQADETTDPSASISSSRRTRDELDLSVLIMNKRIDHLKDQVDQITKRRTTELKDLEDLYLQVDENTKLPHSIRHAAPGSRSRIEPENFNSARSMISPRGSNTTSSESTDPPRSFRRPRAPEAAAPT